MEDAMFSLEAGTNAYFGRLKSARDFSRRAVSSAESEEAKELAASYQADAALREALFGNAVEARQPSTFALGLSNRRSLEYRAALVLALAGDTGRAQASGLTRHASPLQCPPTVRRREASHQ
jgi:hypothetical protein